MTAFAQAPFGVSAKSHARLDVANGRIWDSQRLFEIGSLPASRPEASVEGPNSFLLAWSSAWVMFSSCSFCFFLFDFKSLQEPLYLLSEVCGTTCQIDMCSVLCETFHHRFMSCLIRVATRIVSCSFLTDMVLPLKVMVIPSLS